MRPTSLVTIAGVLIAVAMAGASAGGDALRATDHPRLYFTCEELKALRSGRGLGFRAVMWRNMMDSADWCLRRPVRRTWIAPVSPDPIYANLYDRFYAMMHDMAVMEHLAFACTYGGDERHGKAAVDWALARIIHDGGRK